MAGVLSLLAAVAGAQEHHVVVLLQTPQTPAADLFVEGIRAAFDATPGTVNWYTEAFDTARFPEPEYETTVATYLRDKYAKESIDVVMTWGPDALAFVERRRDSLFPGASIIFAAVRDSRLQAVLPVRSTGLTAAFDLVGTVELALALQPDARELFVLTGVAPLDLEWRAFAGNRLAAYGDRLAVSFLEDKPVRAMLDELSRLPRDSIVLVLTYGSDVAGERFVPPQPLIGRIAAASNAPLYTVYHPWLGNGAVGGYVDEVGTLGADAGELALRILAGESADELPVRKATQEFVVDARQLRRWDFDEARLPPGTVLEFAEPTLWDQYRVEILGVLALIAVQTLAIVALLLRVRKRRVERALRETEDRYRNVVESQHDLICRYLPDTTLTFVNEAYCRYFARSRDGLVGSKFVELLPEADRESAARHVQSLVASPRTEVHVHRTLRPDGSYGWQQWVDHAVAGADGRVVELQGVGRDITELRHAEAEASERREQVTHLTRVAILGELSGALAHELNQPLTAILSNAQAVQMLLARDDLDRKELRDIIDDIVADDVRAGEVIARLRELLKRGKSDFQVLDMDALVAEVLALARAQLARHHVEVVSQLGAGAPRCFGDRVQLQQVLLNLFFNACEAMEGNDPADRTLVVKTLRRDGFIRVTVSDVGPGMLPAVAARLFEPFFTTKAKGLGLGLSICRSIVVAHGGRLHGANNANRGASFELELPIHDEIVA